MLKFHDFPAFPQPVRILSISTDRYIYQNDIEQQDFSVSDAKDG